VWGEKGVKGVKAKGCGSCYQTREQGGWGFVTTSKKLALQVSNAGGYIVDAGGSDFFRNCCTFYKYRDTYPVNINKIFCVQVKNKPCVKYIVIIRLIPWIRSRGSETIESCRFPAKCPNDLSETSWLYFAAPPY
jgi:hypothetical protein